MENLVFLVDSNIFLEGLLEQEQSSKVQSFLEKTKDFDRTDLKRIEP